MLNNISLRKKLRILEVNQKNNNNFSSLLETEEQLIDDLEQCIDEWKRKTRRSHRANMN